MCSTMLSIVGRSPARIETLLHQALDASDAHTVVIDDVGADFMLAFCLLWRGKVDEAEEHFTSGREIARSLAKRPRHVEIVEEARCYTDLEQVFVKRDDDSWSVAAAPTS